MLNSKYIQWLREQSGKKGFYIVLLAIAGGLLQSMVVMVINGALGGMTDEGIDFRFFLMFLMCMAGYILAVRYAVSQTIGLSAQLIYSTQKRLVQKLRDTDCITFEETEQSAIYKNLIESTDILFECSRGLINGLSGVAMLLGSAIYVAVLSFEAFVMIVILVLFGVYIFKNIQKKVEKNLSESKQEETLFLKYFNDFIRGFTEIKMSRARGDDLVNNHMNLRSDRAKFARLQTENHITSNIIFAQSFFLALVGCMVFLLPKVVDAQAPMVVKLVPVVLFFIGPLGAIIAAVPMLSKSDYAMESIARLEERLDESSEAAKTADVSPWRESSEFQGLSLSGVIFKYKNNNGSDVFQLGPIDLEIKPGQIMFLVGGNGTGKSTLMKVMAGLYHPKQGSITLNGKQVDQSNYAYYREWFSLILSDFHIFDRLYGLPQVDQDLVKEMLQKLQMEKRVKFEHGKFSTVDLSTGQKKRMALLTSLLEQKPIMLFDEVAADLDPSFRTYYYQSLLPELRDQGRTIVAVSHDDRYFHLADRVVKLDFGRLT